MKKLNLNVNVKSAVGIAAAVIAGISAFSSAIDGQKKDKLLSEAIDRITKLENGRES